MELKIASWNINSVRLRAQTVVRFLKQWQPDILTLQETKCPPGQFPSTVFTEAGYSHIADNGQCVYHGVAIVSRLPFADVQIHQFCGKQDARHISVRIDGKNAVNVHSFYVPSGGDIPDPDKNEKFAHKLCFLQEMQDWLTESYLHKSGPSVLTGDLNIAPDPNDVWSHKQLLKAVSHTPLEVERLERVRKAGNWTDILRKCANEEEKLYSWWSYRSRDWEKSNRGRRLDHIWLDESLKNKCKNTAIITETRGWEKPSDHVPVMATLKLD